MKKRAWNVAHNQPAQTTALSSELFFHFTKFRDQTSVLLSVVQYALKPIIYEDNQPGGMGIINQSSLMKTFFFSLLLPFMYFKTWPAALYYTENVNPRRPLHNMN